MRKNAAQKRMSEIIRELSRMSRNSWHDARPCEYLPLEAELRTLRYGYDALANPKGVKPKAVRS